MVGPAFKTKKSEFVAWQEAFSAKSMICMMKISMTNPNRFCLTTWHGSRRNCVRSWQVPLHASICGASKGGYTTSAGTDWRSQMLRKLFVPMATSSSGRLCCYPGNRKSHGTRRHASVNRTDAQTSKVWTIQMMMTLILTPALRVKTNTNWVSSRVLIITQWGVYWNCISAFVFAPHIQDYSDM